MNRTSAMTIETLAFDTTTQIDSGHSSRDADPDRDVVALVRRGEVADALRRLMARHGTPIYRYCCEELRDAALADDTHQQVFIAAFRCLPSFAGRSTMRAWLFGIARHRVLDAVKARNRVRARATQDGYAEPAEALDPRPSPGDALDDMRLREALIAELALLPEQVRAAILLRYQQGLSIEEIATILDEKPGSVSARVLRAMPLLRKRIEARLNRR